MVKFVLVGLVACNAGENVPNCDQAVDSTLRLYDRQTPSLTLAHPDRRGYERDSLVAACHALGWDATERQCVVEARDLAKFAACHVAGDRRRHPDWPWR